jgi:glycosyltransferase involved in cell wall biosynthesis
LRWQRAVMHSMRVVSDVPLAETNAVSDAAHAVPRLLSIIICNHNYEAFVAQAIESALAIDWPDVEIIVVDDGSTDRSRSIIAAYADRVTVIHQENAGQWSACNAGFARSRGDVVIFLDSDDLLDPSLMRRLSTVWRAGLSKVQFQMKIIDETGRATGSVLPQFHRVPSCEEIREWALNAAAYPTPPGSGNAYSRAFLEKIFPLSGGDRAADSYCLAAAPYLGDVVTLAEPLVSYRLHGKNQGAMAKLDASRFAFEVNRARFRLRFARSAARGVGVPATDDVLNRSLSFLPYRLASLKLLPAKHPIERDSSWKLLYDVTAACFTPQGATKRTRAALWAWAVAVAVAPEKLGAELVRWRFSPASRPALVQASLRRLRVLKEYRADA